MRRSGCLSTRRLPSSSRLNTTREWRTGGPAAAATTRESSLAVSGSRVQRAETPRRLPDGRHRALPQVQDLGLGGRRRDAPRGCLDQQD